MLDSVYINDASRESLTGNKMVDLSYAPIVVNSAYITSKDARPQVLSNGWIVTTEIALNVGIKFQVSKDGGVTWSSLAYIDAVYSSMNVSVASKGTIIYLILCGTSASTVYYYTFDVTMVNNTLISSHSGTIDTNQSGGFGTGCSLVINPAQTELHATWCSKNATYPNSFNIRYAKGIIAGDGSVTWGSVTQITTQNNSTYHSTQPCIVTDSSVPIILYAADDYNFISSGWDADYKQRIVCLRGDSTLNLSNALPSGWSYSVVCDGGIYAQSSPDAIVDKNGVLWVSWFGMDSVDSATFNIHCSKSIDGTNWLKPSDNSAGNDKLTNGNIHAQYYPSITCDINNNIHVYWSGSDGTKYQLRKSVFTTSWSGIQTITSNISGNANYPSTCNNDMNAVRYIWQDNNSSTVRFDAIPRPQKIISPFIDGTPSVVINQAYDTSGNGGRKLVKLSNGWLVSAVYDGSVPCLRWYKSTDNGVSWISLGNSTTPFTASCTDFSLASSGTMVYAVVNVGVYCASKKFDATTVTDAILNATQGLIDTQTSLGACSLVIDSNGKLWAAWSSKNATYPNSFNIRVSSSTDGGVTWAIPTQLTTNNASGINWITPSIITFSNNYPFIVASYSNTSSPFWDISYIKWTGSSWTAWDGTQLIYNSGYDQNNPCCIIKKSGSNVGRIFAVWNGRDTTDTSKQNVRVNYSDDAGATWPTAIKITSGNTVDRKNVTLSEDAIGNIYALYEDNGTLTYQICPNGSTTFGTVTTLNAGTNPSSLDYNTGKPSFVYRNMGSVKYDTAETVKPKISYSGLPPEIYIPLWFYSGNETAGANSFASSGYLLAKGGLSLTDSSNGKAKLHTLNSSWSIITKFAFEASIRTTASVGYAELWDITSNIGVVSSQILTTSTTHAVLRSGQFTLIPGHVYGVAIWVTGGATMAITDASLIVFSS